MKQLLDYKLSVVVPKAGYPQVIQTTAVQEKQRVTAVTTGNHKLSNKY